MIRLIFRLFAALILAVLLALAGFRLAAYLGERETAEALAPATGQFIDTSEGRIFVQEAGPPDGPPVLFIHGSGAWSGFWREVIDARGAQGDSAIAMDLTPFGFSERAADRDYSRVRQAERILALVDAMDIKPILVAHSFGAAPASEAAMLRPDAFEAMILVAGAVGLGSYEARASLPLPLRSERVRRWLGAATALNPWLTGPLLKQMLANKDAATPEQIAILQAPAARAGSTEALADWLPSLLLPATQALSVRKENWQALEMPVALIWGDTDHITPPEQARLLAKLTKSEVAWLASVGHIPHIEAPALFAERLAQAIDEVQNR